MKLSSISLFHQHQAEFQDSIRRFFEGEPAALTVGARLGSIKLIDGLLLYELVCREKPARILEVGSFLGFSTRWLLAASEHFGGCVTAFDPGIPHRIFADTLGHLKSYCGDFSDRLEQVQGYLPPVRYAQLAKKIHDCGQWPGSLAAVEARLRSIPEFTEPFGRFDFAFVDGDHSYKATQANVELVSRMIEPGGLIVVHDAVTWLDVEPALFDLCAGSQGTLELIEIAGQALHEDMVPYFERRMTPPNAKYACNSFSNGMAVVRVKTTPLA